MWSEETGKVQDHLSALGQSVTERGKPPVVLTLFSCPKPFRGRIHTIQRNAIQSWIRLNPRPEVFLLGDEEGTAEAVREFDLGHIPQVALNEFGTPLVNSIFEEAEKAATTGLMGYVNADLILMSDFVGAIHRVLEQEPRFLLVGRRWNLDIRDALLFDAQWERQLKGRIAKEGVLHPHFAVDYFVFPKGVLGEIPPFAIGRPAWDNWILYRARSLDLPIIDLTPAVTVVHQNHDYSHHPKGWTGAMKGDESRRNIELAGDVAHVHSLLDAQFYLTRKGVRRRIRPYYSPFYLYRSLVILSNSRPSLKPLVRVIQRLGDRFLSHPVNPS